MAQSVTLGASLHSRYNPQAEAVRYIDSLNLNASIECFILIEPGLGYIIPVLRERFKNSKILVLHVEDFPQDKSFSNTFTHAGIETAKIQEFLETHIQELNIDRIKVIEWRHSLNYYKEAYLKILSSVAAFLKRADAEKRTTAAFGKRWVRNFFKNIANINHTLLYRQTEIPVIVTGSGPSLEQALPVIQKSQKNCLIIAASSSVLALSSADIKPDIVIATDGGNWALKHIYPFYRNYKNAPPSALAVNLCAALPSQCADTAQLIINDGSFWQSVVLHELALPSVIIPQRGTVTATAVDLALLLTGGNIYLAGLDFLLNDIRTHARPYCFDNLFYGSANRFNPFYSTIYSRAKQLHSGGSMNIYESWFREQLNKWQKRIYSIGGNKIFENGVPSACGGVKNTDEFFSTVSFENSNNVRERGIQALLNAIKNPQYAQSLKQELNSLLFAGENNVTDTELESMIHAACAGGFSHT